MSTARRRWEAIARDFLEADTRWLALFRIAFGLTMLGYLGVVGSCGRLDAYFTERGLMPLAVLREMWPVHYDFTLFRFVHTHGEAVAAFALTALVYLFFTLGLFTRWVAPLVLVATVSLHHRLPFVVNGAMVTMHLLALWSMLLPLGRHASIDAWLAARRGAADPPMRVRSLAMLAIRLQLAAIYLFNVLHKGGPTWRRGEAVHYVLWQARAALPSAVWLRQHEPSWFSPLATYGTFVVESAICLLVLAPFARVASRRLAAVLIVCFHSGLATLLNLGPFPFVFACAAILLASSEDGRSIERFIGPRGPAVDEASAASASPARRRAREAVIFAFLLHAAFLVYVGNPVLITPAASVRRLAWLDRAGDAMYVWQRWCLFAPDAPTRDLVLVPVVTLADERVLDARSRRPPDFELLDGRPYPTDFFRQTLDPRLADRGSYSQWDAFARYLARVPELESWPGERRVAEVEVHVLSVDRAPPGRPQPDFAYSRVAFTKRFLPLEAPGQLGP